MDKKKLFGHLREDELKLITGNIKDDKIDNLMSSFVIPDRATYLSMREKVKKFVELQGELYKVNLYVYSLKPHDSNRKQALSAFAEVADLLDKALFWLGHTYHNKDIIHFGKCLEQNLNKKGIELPEALTIDASMKGDSLKQYFDDGTKNEHFPYKRNGISTLLKAMIEAANEVNASIPKKTGGTPNDDGKAVLERNFKDFFKLHTGIKGREGRKEEFLQFKQDMYLLLFGEESYPHAKVREYRHKINSPTPPKTDE